MTRIQFMTILAMTATFSAAACTTPAPEENLEWREQIGHLPSGVAISVDIEEPYDGDYFPAGTSVKVHGTASIGEAEAIAKYNLVYIGDQSGSTLDKEGCGGDINKDGHFDTVLDCEILAMLEVNKMALDLGTIKKVGYVGFGTYGAAADLAPFGAEKLLTPPDADLNHDGVPDIEEVLRSLERGRINLFQERFVSTWTSFGNALGALHDVLDYSHDETIVAMMSDGENNRDPKIWGLLDELPDDVVIYTFAVGKHVSCEGLAQYDHLGSLQDIADKTGGTCTEVPDVEDLPDILPSVIATKLTGLEFTVNGKPKAIDITPDLVQKGPVSVKFSTTLHDIAPGTHELCATATGSDASGSKDVTECVKIHVNRAPVAKCEDVTIKAGASCKAYADIDAGSYDPDYGDDFGCKADPKGPYPVGDTKVTLTCTDEHGAESWCTAWVTVIDDSKDEFEVDELLATLWPPNHKYETFDVKDCVRRSKTKVCRDYRDYDDHWDGHWDDDHWDDDHWDDHWKIELRRVTSNEAELELGAGNTCDDILINENDKYDTEFSVRAERAGPGDGRVYSAHFRVWDHKGNYEDGVCHVVVPHNPNAEVELPKYPDKDCKLCEGTGCKCDNEGPACGAKGNNKGKGK